MDKTDPTFLGLRLWLNNNPDVVATEAAPSPPALVPCADGKVSRQELRTVRSFLESLIRMASSSFWLENSG